MSEKLARGPVVQRPLVATVVLNWHGRDRTLRCIAALGRLDYPRHRLVLVDNGSADFSAEEAEALFPEARYLRTPENLGFAAGANRGMAVGLALGAAYVWFLNNDAEPEPAALAEMIAVAEGGQAAAIVGAKILRRDEPRRLDSIALRVDLGRGRNYLIGHDEIDRGQYDRLADVAAVSGCAMLVARAACKRLGGFDESFFSYLEDADLCLRARETGLGVAIAPRARVLHDRPSATGGRQSVASVYYTTRNHLTLIRRHLRGGPVRRQVSLASAAALNLTYALRPGLGSYRERSCAVWRALADYRNGVGGPGSPAGVVGIGSQGNSR